MLAITPGQLEAALTAWEVRARAGQWAAAPQSTPVEEVGKANAALLWDLLLEEQRRKPEAA